LTWYRELRTENKSQTVWLAALLGVALFAVPATLSAQVSLPTVVDLAQRNSTTTRMAEADMRKAQAEYSQSRDAVIPSVFISTGIPTFPQVGFTGSPPSIWSASVQSLIFGIPQKRFIDAGRLGIESAEAHLNDARQQVALDASVAYIELNTVNRERDSARQQEGFANRLVDIEQERAEAGIDPLSELLQARLTAAEIKLARIRLEGRASTLATELASLTGLPVGSITPDPASIPEIPKLNGKVPPRAPEGIHAAQLLAQSKQLLAKGDQEISYFPQLSFIAQYNRNTTLLNDVNSYFARPLPANNFSSGISIQIPIFDMGHRAKSRATAADALRARVEAEEAERKNEEQIAQLNGTLRELDALAEVASLKQQIATEQLKTVLTQLELGNGSGVGPGSTPQLSPKAEQLARIDASQKLQDSLDAGFNLAKARLNLLRATGHMEDWVHELHSK
jgi:outer membrane protein TolC